MKGQFERSQFDDTKFVARYNGNQGTKRHHDTPQDAMDEDAMCLLVSIVGGAIFLGLAILFVAAGV